MEQKTMIRLDGISNFFIFGLVLSMLMFANGLYLFACMATLALLFFQIQRPYHTGVFTLILFQHLIQVITSVIQANYLDADINYRSPENGTSIILSLFGIAAIFIPVLYFQNRLPKVSLEILRKNASVLSIDKAMYFYIAAFFITSLLSGIAFMFSGLTQVIVSLVKIKWLFFLLFGFLCFLKNEKKSIFIVFIILEILIGFFSYFSDFKTVIYYLLIMQATFIVKINFRNIFNIILISSGLIFLALVWTSVKGEYRKYLNSGTGQQTISVSRDDALDKLYDLSSDVDKDNLERSTNDFLDRLQYTYHFARAIERVPAVIPYQNGANWLEVLQFTTTPRFLNPDKPSIDNSVKATKYTGIQYARAKKGVSFSLGYFAECYIDFGAWGMMVPLLLIGVLFGKLYHYFITKASPNLLLNYAVVGSFFMEFYAYEMDATYFIGRLFASILTYLVLIKFAFPLILGALRADTQKRNYSNN